jgi:hypothetical protein
MLKHVQMAAELKLYDPEQYDIPLQDALRCNSKEICIYLENMYHIDKLKDAIRLRKAAHSCGDLDMILWFMDRYAVTMTDPDDYISVLSRCETRQQLQTTLTRLKLPFPWAPNNAKKLILHLRNREVTEYTMHHHHTISINSDEVLDILKITRGY